MLDLFALDAELESLGRAPENSAALAQTFAGITLAGGLLAQLAEVDVALAALAEGSEIAFAPAPAPLAPRPVAHSAVETPRMPDPFVERALPSLAPAPFDTEPPPPMATAALDQSQEIVLPDPIAREELSSESGELSLDGDEPSSGSFALPESAPEPHVVAHDQPLSASASTELTPFDDVQDALEGSQPIAIGSRSTVGPSADMDRDPDAEFDALLSEATDPRGIPTAGLSSEIDTDNLLRGLEGDELDEGVALVESDSAGEAEALTRSLYEEAGDSTDILDRASLGLLEPTASEGEMRPDASLADELDSGELEILMDDEEPSVAPPLSPLSVAPKPPPPKAPTARPSTGKAPPPPPPSSSPEKRPSGGLFNRLFTKREGE